MPKVKRVIHAPTRRSTRVQSAVKEEADGKKELGSKWMIEEKQCLLQGIKRFGLMKLELIQQQFLPQRHLQDINQFIRRIKVTSKRLLNDAPTERQAPIEIWLHEAQSLTTGEQDYSYTLSQLFSLFGTVEPHDRLPRQKMSPDWGAIYQYLSQLLLGNSPPLPSKIDASLILDLLEQLATDLKGVDMTDQCRLMSLKYELLKQHLKVEDKDAACLLLQRALDEEPPEENTTTSDSGPRVDSVETPEPSTSTSDTPAGCHGNPSPSDTSAGRHGNPSPSVSAKASLEILQPKKTALYSLNPFNIPIKHLKLKPKSGC